MAHAEELQRLEQWSFHWNRVQASTHRYHGICDTDRSHHIATKHGSMPEHPEAIWVLDPHCQRTEEQNAETLEIQVST